MVKNKVFLVFVILTLLYPALVSSVRINEVMYNPKGSDNNKEFVEIIGTNNLSRYVIGDLASNDSLEMIVYGQANLSLIVEEEFNLSGIHTDSSSTIRRSVYSAGSTIGNGLNNGGDTVFLYNGSELVDFMGYDGSLASDNGFSLVLINGSWQESCEYGGSPGAENCVVINNQSINESINQIVNETINETINNTPDNTQEENTTQENTTNTTKTKKGLELEIIIPETLFLGMTYDSLFRITNQEHVSGVQSQVFAEVKYNVTSNNSLVAQGYFNKTINYYSSAGNGRLFFEQTGNYTLCGMITNSSLINEPNMLNASDPDIVCKDFEVINPASIPCVVELNLSTDKEHYFSKDKVKIKNSINNKSFPYIIEYWAEDLFGQVVKKEYNTSNTNTKQWTPSIAEVDRVFVVKNRLVFVACNNTANKSRQENEKIIIIQKNTPDLEDSDALGSSISIDYVYTPLQGLLFGNEFKVKLSIHKGDTRKSVVSAWVETDKDGNNRKVSDETGFYLNKKNYDYNLTIKVSLKPDCEQEFKPGDYVLVVEGLGVQEDEELKITGHDSSVCPEKTGAETKGSIVSFYTRSKKYDDQDKKVNLYANVEVEEEHILILLTQAGKTTRTVNQSGKQRFETTVVSGKNLAVLELRKKDKVVDAKTLLFELESGQETTATSGLEVMGKKDASGESFANPFENASASMNDANSIKNIAGSVVYEADSAKLTKHVPYLISVVLGLVVLTLLFFRRR